jgi:hypothetical protein
MFTLGGSSEEEDSSFEQRVLSVKAPPQRSSLSQSLSKTKMTDTATKAPSPKRTSFRDIVTQRRIQEAAENDEGAIASSDEEEDDDDDDTDEITESAIEDDDEEDNDDWEDDTEDPKPLEPRAVFKRVESRPDLVSRRSMLTLALNKGALNHAYSQPSMHCSRPVSPDGLSMAESPDDDDGMVMHTSKRRPIAIPPPSTSAKSVAHSPRTTRRNMLSTELTESLRKNLLWERQQKSQAANAAIKFQRNAKSMANLQARDGPNKASVTLEAPPPAAEPSKNSSWNDYDDKWNYHTKGW